MLIFKYFSAYFVLLPLFFGLLKFAKLEKFQKVLTVYLGASLLSDFTAILFRNLFRNNLVVYDLWHIFELPAILMIYSYIIYGSVKKRPFIFLTSIFIIIYSLEKIISSGNVVLIMSNTAFISKLIILFTSVFVIFRVSLDTDRKLINSSRFIVLAGFTVNFAITAPMTLLYVFLPASLLKGSAIVQASSNLFMYSCFTYSYIISLRGFKNTDLSSPSL